MKRKNLFGGYVLVAAGSLGMTIATVTDVVELPPLDLAFPFAQIGDGLRGLSLASPIGNIAAIALYVLISMLPVIYFLLRLVRKSFRVEDLILLAMSALLFLVLYRMINPGLLTSMIPSASAGQSLDLMKGAWCLTFDSVLAAYCVVRLVRSSHSRMIMTFRSIQGVLMLINLILIFGILGSELSILLRNLTGQPTSGFELIVLFFLSQIPTILTLIVLTKAYFVVDEIKCDLFSPTTLAESAALTRMAALAIVGIMISVVLKNGYQLIVSNRLADITFVLYLPLTSIVAVLMVYFLSSLLAQSRKLQQENDLFV